MTSVMDRNIKPDTAQLLETAHQWIVRLEDPGHTKQDRNAFEQWLKASPRHKSLYDQAVSFKVAITQLDEDDLEADVVQPSRAETLTAALDRAKELGSSWKFQMAAVTLAAGIAAIAIIAPGGFGAPTQMVQSSAVIAHYATATGETRTFELSDGTTVTLGAASAITARYSDKMRTIELVAGSGFFAVAKDKTRPFSVAAGKLTATALGTQFDVRKGANVTRVAVAEGTVEVSYPLTIDGKSMAMRSRKNIAAGQQIAATRHHGLDNAKAVNAEKVGAWREDRLVYTGETLAEVVFDANRYSTTPIVIAPGSQSITGFRMRGVFRGTDVDRLLSSIAQIHPVEIDRSSPSAILLSSKDER